MILVGQSLSIAQVIFLTEMIHRILFRISQSKISVMNATYTPRIESSFGELLTFCNEPLFDNAGFS